MKTCNSKFIYRFSVNCQYKSYLCFLFSYVTYVKLLGGFAIIWITQIVAGFERTQSSWDWKCGMDIFLGWHLFICLFCTRKVSRVICSKRKFDSEGKEVVILPLRDHVKNKIHKRKTRFSAGVPQSFRAGHLESNPDPLPPNANA